MQVVEGETLQDAINAFHAPQSEEANQAWTRLRLLDVFRQVCEIVGSAHARGVIHRDLKPSNVMLSAFGAVRVVDWGLVKVLDLPDQSFSLPDFPSDDWVASKADDTVEATVTSSPRPVMTDRSSSGQQATRMGLVAGTHGYMPPEQASGRIVLLCPASDVFALGAILYAVVSGEAPLDEREARQRLRSEREVSSELCEICLKAMSPAIADRFPNANALGERIALWLEEALQREQRRTYTDDIERLFSGWDSHEQKQVREGVLRLFMSDGTPIHRQYEVMEPRALQRMVEAGIVEVTADRVSVIQSSIATDWERLRGWLDADPQGQALRLRLIESTRDWAQRNQPHELLWRGERLADLRSWKRRRDPLLHPMELAFLDDSTRQASRALRRQHALRAGAFVGLGIMAVMTTILWWQADGARALEQEARRAAELRSLSFAAAQMQITNRLDASLALHRAWLSVEPDIELVRQGTERLASMQGSVHILTGHRDSVTALDWKPASNSRFASASVDGFSHLWDANSGQIVRSFQHESPVVDQIWSPDGALLASIDMQGQITLWDAETGEVRRQWSGHGEAGNEIAFSPDGHWLVSSAVDGTSRVWRTATGEEYSSFSGAKKSQSWARFSQDGSRLVTSGAGRIARVWDMESRAEMGRLTHSESLEKSAFSPTADLVASVTARDVLLWEVASGEVVRVMTEAHASIHDVWFTEDGRSLVTLGSGVRVWDLGEETKYPTEEYWNLEDHIVDAGFGPKQATVITAQRSHRVDLWVRKQRAASRFPLETLDIHEGVVEHVRLSPNGRQLAIAASDGTIRVWEPRLFSSTGSATCIDPKKWQGIIDLSPDGGHFVQVSDFGKCVVQLGQQGHTLPNFIKGDKWLVTAWSEDSERVVTWVDATTLGIWRAQDAERLSSLSVDPETQVVGLINKGRSLILVDPDGMLQTWSLPDAVEPTLSMEIQLSSPVEYSIHHPVSDYAIFQMIGGKTEVWDVFAGRRVLVFENGHSDRERPALSRNGTHVLTFDQSGRIELWSVNNAEMVRAFTSPQPELRHVAMSEDMRWIAASTIRGTVFIWEQHSGNLHGSLQVGSQEHASIEFSLSPDNNLIVQAADGEAQVWQVAGLGALLTVPSDNRFVVADVQPLPDGSLMTTGVGGYRIWPIPSQQPAEHSGLLTNLRVCRDTFKVVPVTPFPAADTLWASPELCAPADAP